MNLFDVTGKVALVTGASRGIGEAAARTLAAFQKTVDVNIRGYFFMSSLGAKLMAKGGGRGGCLTVDGGFLVG